MGYMLYVDERPVGPMDTLEEVKQMAKSYMGKKVPLRIESMVAPAPSRFWSYDYELSDWVEQL